MSGPAIRVESLGKRFRIGEGRSPYKTVRESLVRSARSAIRGAGGLVRGERRRPSGHETIWALKDVSFTIAPGEVVGIIGRNGAGKSTLLKILARITEPTEGWAEIRGRVGSLLEVGTGFHPELTGRENIFLNGAILGMGRLEIERKLDEIVAFAEVDRFLDTPVKHYSSGMYLRLAFSVAAHLDPEILLVDEVLAVGDMGFQNKCLKRMRDVSETGRTVLFVSHNLGAVHQLCKRCILLDAGGVEADGETDDVIGTYVSKGLTECGEYSAGPDPTKDIHLRRVRLCGDDGSSRTQFRYDDEVVVEIEFEVNRELRDTSVWAGVQTAEGVWVFGTADCDSDAAALGVRGAGYFRAVFQIPPSWLNAGRYRLVVGITRHAPLFSFDRVEAAEFTILDVNTPARVSTGRSRPGVLQPLLPWATKAAKEESV